MGGDFRKKHTHYALSLLPSWDMDLKVEVETLFVTARHQTTCWGWLCRRCPRALWTAYLHASFMQVKGSLWFKWLFSWVSCYSGQTRSLVCTVQRISWQRFGRNFRYRALRMEGGRDFSWLFVSLMIWSIKREWNVKCIPFPLRNRDSWTSSRGLSKGDRSRCKSTVI